jgi:hypothetical protein
MSFFPEHVTLPAGLPEEAKQGAKFLLAKLSADPALEAGGAPLAWAAYMLATVEHETWRRFVPVEETGCGLGKPYGVALRVVCADDSVRQNSYYGRGYVQLTWQANYARVGAALGMGRALFEQPELALEPETAYRILSCGMVRGLFTGKRLAGYLTAARVDYVQARRVINGLDCAERIAALAIAWEQRLRVASCTGLASAVSVAA